MSGRRLSDGEWEMVFGRCAKGDWSTQPISDAWVSKYGFIIQQFRGGFPPDTQTTRSLLALPPRVRLSTRSTWPVGVRNLLDAIILLVIRLFTNHRTPDTGRTPDAL